MDNNNTSGLSKGTTKLSKKKGGSSIFYANQKRKPKAKDKDKNDTSGLSKVTNVGAGETIPPVKQPDVMPPVDVTPQVKQQAATSGYIRAYNAGEFAFIADTDETEETEDWVQRQFRSRALGYRYPGYYGPNDEQKTCIWSTGSFSWNRPNSGISWIGVTGTDAALVVALSEGIDAPPTPRRCSGRIQLPSVSVLFTAICDMGVGADTSTEYTEFRQRMIAESSKVGPFAVVSAAVAPGADAKDNLESSQVAINFLLEKLKGRSALTYREMKQMAVCALKHLSGPKFDPNMIELMSSGKGDRLYHNFRVGALEVEELLAAINLT